MQNYADLLFQGHVRRLQDEDGTGDKYAQAYKARTPEGLNEDEAAFIEARDSFYIASVSETGWPYVQHRGGPRGFLKVLGPTTLGFADYRGNRQYITTGHVAADDRVALFLTDYAAKARLKLLGHMRVEPLAEASAETVEAVTTPGQGRAERIVTIEVAARDWNCPQFLPDLYPADMVRAAVAQQTRAMAEEAQALRAEVKRLGGTLPPPAS